MPTGIPAVARAKLTWSGAVGSGKWACSLWCSRSVDTVPLQIDIDNAATAIYGLWATDVLPSFELLNFTSTNVSDFQVDVYHPSSNASFARGDHIVSGGAGTSTATSAASQAIVTTTQSAQVGRSGRGRIYLPATAFLPATPGYQFPTSPVAALATGWASFMSDLIALGPITTVGALVPVVSSGGSAVSGGPGPALYPIVKTRVDTQPDRQEHREKGITFTSAQGSV